jgi:predicted HTH transcriptional regulator
VLLIATRVTTPPPREVHQLVAAGESATVEFKSTARFNLHSGKRDERIELVIAKTVAALANAEGGHLIIGVDDEGTVLGLGDDLALMKRPDIDRYELWLRDYLTNTIGAALTTTLDVSFPTLADAALEDQPVCWIQVPAAVRPVFLVPGKSQPPQLWVRVGNSTRQLPLDQALAYASDRWGRRRLSAIGR